MLYCQPGERLQSSRGELARQLDVVETADTLKLPLLWTVIQQSRGGTPATDTHDNQQRRRSSLTQVCLSLPVCPLFRFLSVCLLTPFYLSVSLPVPLSFSVCLSAYPLLFVCISAFPSFSLCLSVFTSINDKLLIVVALRLDGPNATHVGYMHADTQ